MQYNRDSEELTRQIFMQLATVNGKEKSKTNEKGQKSVYFDQADFSKARIEYPELFEWLDYPEQYVETFLKQLDDNREKMIKAEELENYHA